MKKKISSYWAGILSTALILILTTTALAASGQVTFNFANVSLYGAQKITAGTDITADNGQKVPSSILYTDTAGGKTNYLPIRTISELLGVEIDYDSATTTVQLHNQPAEGSTIHAGTLGLWQRIFQWDTVGYSMSGCSETPYAQAPAWRPTWLPEGWALDSSGVELSSNAFIQAFYTKDPNDEENELYYECFAPSNRTCSDFLGFDVDGPGMLQKTTVQGYDADFFQAEDFNLLVWSDTAGNLFKLQGTLNQATLERIANSVAEVSKDPLPEYYMQWTPEGSYNTSRASIPNVVRETWKDATGTSFEWIYTPETLAVPLGGAESVTVNGVKAQFWTGEPNGGFDLDPVFSNGIPTHIYTREQKNTLLWTIPDSNLTFRLVGMMEKEEMIKMAESVTLK